MFQVSQSLKRLRDYINTNVVDVTKCKWITLTYAENMTNTRLLYKDFKNFMAKMRYYFSEYKIEYIVAMEPQGRGSWHAHLILIFDRTAPFIPNSTIERIWEHGFTVTHKLDNIDNVGAYLTAYLGDMEYNEKNLNLLREQTTTHTRFEIKEVAEIDDIKLNTPKKFIKGGRLYLYPPKFNLYRCSRGIKAPDIIKLPYSEAIKKVGCASPTFTSAIKLIDNISLKPFDKTIAYEFYNTSRKVPQN